MGASRNPPPGLLTAIIARLKGKLNQPIFLNSMLLHSLDSHDASIRGAASASQSPLQHLPRNVNTGTGFSSVLAGELALPALPPLPGTIRAAAQANAAASLPASVH